MERKGFWEGVSEETNNPNNKAIYWGKINFNVKKFIILAQTALELVEIWRKYRIEAICDVFEEFYRSTDTVPFFEQVRIAFTFNVPEMMVKFASLKSQKPLPINRFLSNVAWISWKIRQESREKCSNGHLSTQHCRETSQPTFCTWLVVTVVADNHLDLALVEASKILTQVLNVTFIIT